MAFADSIPLQAIWLLTSHKIKGIVKSSSTFVATKQKFRTIAKFKIFVKQNNDSNKTCRYAQDLLLYRTSSK